MSNDAAGIGMSFSFGPGEEKGDAAARRPDPPQASFQAAGAVEVPAQPLRLLVLANLRGLPEQRDLAPRRVRLATLDEDLAALAPTLRLDVKDHLTGGPRPLEVVATLRAKRDLEPDRLAGACDALAPVVALLDDLDALASDPAVAERVEARRAAYDGLAGLAPALAALDRALRGLRGGGAPSRAGGGALDSVLAAGAKAASGDAVLDSIFAMVDAGPATPAPSPSTTTKTTATTTSSGGGSWRADLDEARAQASGLLERQLGEVLRHPQTRQVEAAWRSLELLLARCPRDGRVEVEALDCDPDAPEAALIHGVVRRHAAPDAPPAPSLVVMDATFGRSAADLARLELIAEAAEALQAPVVVGLGDAFLGTDLPALAALDHPAGALERGLEKWNGLRAGPSFRWLVAATNRVLLRAPWSRGQRGARRAGEQVATRDDLCWGNPAYLVAAAAAASVDRTGWPADLTDPAGLADLVMDPAAPPERRGPLEPPLALDAVEALNDLGVLAPTGPRDRDVARITRAPTAHRAPADEPRFASSLPYQLAASRIAAALLRARGVLARAGDPEAVRARIERFAAGLVGDTGPGAGAQASLVRGQDGPEVEVEVRTGRAVLGGVSVTLGLAL
jgi:predicted component of type VI protein secretion system